MPFFICIQREPLSPRERRQLTKAARIGLLSAMLAIAVNLPALAVPAVWGLLADSIAYSGSLYALAIALAAYRPLRAQARDAEDDELYTVPLNTSHEVYQMNMMSQAAARGAGAPALR